MARRRKIVGQNKKPFWNENPRKIIAFPISKIKLRSVKNYTTAQNKKAKKNIFILLRPAGKIIGFSSVKN
jgi:hypothetical protein